jgi:hypothetical protein
MNNIIIVLNFNDIINTNNNNTNFSAGNKTSIDINMNIVTNILALKN